MEKRVEKGDKEEQEWLWAPLPEAPTAKVQAVLVVGSSACHHHHQLSSTSQHWVPKKQVGAVILSKGSFQHSYKLPRRLLALKHGRRYVFEG